VERTEASKGSVAAGLALLAALAGGLVAAQAVVARLPAAPSPRASVCDSPVEVVEPEGLRLLCAADLPPSCAAAQAGDRVQIDAQSCAVGTGGMSAAARLLSGLPLDVNRATAAELELLDGIGPKLAQAIVADRAAHGPFASIEELDRVRGIGPGLLARIREQLQVLGAAP
jgi:competence ComEA-like helix-hairpin-helix protein